MLSFPCQELRQCDSLPDITAGATAPAQERHRALMPVAGIAATAGAVGQPVMGAVNEVPALLWTSCR